MKKKIGLLWHSFTSDNLGVGALSVSHMALLDRVADELGIELSYKVMGTLGGLDYLGCVAKAPVETLLISPRSVAKNPFSLINAFDGCDLVLDLGEGDSFADIYGQKRYLLFALTKLVALCKGVPLVLSPQTVGPFATAFARVTARHLLKCSVRVFPRDGLSRRYLEEQGVAANCCEAIDLAFSLPFDRGERFSAGTGKLHLGVNPSALLYNGGYQKNNQFGLVFEYRDFITRLLTPLSSRQDVVLHLVPHVISDTVPVEDDYRTALKIQSAFPRCTVAPRFASPVEAKSYISRLDFFVGSRMHATIAAFSSGVPVLPVAYSRKFRGLFDSLDYPWVVDATSEPLDRALERVWLGLERREELAGLVAQGNLLARRKLRGYEDFLREFLGGGHGA